MDCANAGEAKAAPTPRAPAPRRRRLRWLGWFTLVYCAASVLASFIPEMPSPVRVLESRQVKFSGQLVAGAARMVITPPRELWERLNLYGEQGPIRGVADDLCVRALTLGARGSEPRGLVSIVSVELLIIPPTLRPAVKEELAKRGLGHVEFVLNATHTHAGPGNFWDLWFAHRFMGKYSDEYFRFLVGRIGDAVELSVESMRPARIAFGETRTRHLLRQRRYKDPVTGLAPPLDEELEVIRVDAKDGGVLAYALNVGAHPTSLLHSTAHRVSGDFPGAISRLLEAEPGPASLTGTVALFLQGAEGSVSASAVRPYQNYRGIREGRFAKVAMEADMLRTFTAEAEAHMTFDDRIDLASVTAKVALPPCDVHLFPEKRPYLVVRILTIIPNWIFNRVVGWIGFPRETTFQALRINHAYLLTFPGDLGNRVGWEIRQHLRRDHVLVLGQSNDYSLGYVLAREEYDMGGLAGLAGSERIQCYFGKRAGPFCIKVAADLANLVREEGADDILQYSFGDHPGVVPRAKSEPRSPKPESISNPQ